MTSEFDKTEVAGGLRRILGEERVIADAPMAKYTSFRAGGAADLMAVPRSREELQEVIRYLSEEKIPHMVLGNGSNILVRDGGYRGVIVRIGEALGEIRQEGNALICGSGALLSAAAKAAAQAGLTGLEFASGIPGSIGGAVFMNAGAYGGEMKDVLEYVKVLEKDGSAFTKVEAVKQHP